MHPRYVRFWIFVLAAILVALAWYDEQPSTPTKQLDSDRTFRSAKVTLAKLYKTDLDARTFYCGCSFSGKTVDLNSCGYKIRSNADRAKRLEWEHIVPASFYGQTLPCWKRGGRKACSGRDKAFDSFEGDLHNLVPAVGEVNGDRSNFPYGIVTPHTRTYGDCRMQIRNGVAEPPDDVKGDVARVWLFMIDKYGLTVSAATKALYDRWNGQDPVDDRELARHARVARVQNETNPYITGP